MTKPRWITLVITLAAFCVVLPALGCSEPERPQPRESSDQQEITDRIDTLNQQVAELREEIKSLQPPPTRKGPKPAITKTVPTIEFNKNTSVPTKTQPPHPTAPLMPTLDPRTAGREYLWPKPRRSRRPF